MDVNNKKKFIVILTIVLINVVMILAAAISVIQSVKNTLELEASGQLASSSEEEYSEEEVSEEETEDISISVADIASYIQTNGLPGGASTILTIMGCIMIFISMTFLILIKLGKIDF